MVSHVRADRDLGLPRRQTRRSVVDRLVESIRALPALLAKELEVFAGKTWHDHERHCCGVGGDHLVIGQAPLQSQARDAERAVLVVQVNVGPVVA